MDQQYLLNDTPREGAALGELERQVERGSLFTHTALGRSALRLNEVESFTYGLLDALLARGLVSAEEVGAAVERVRGEMLGEADLAHAGVALRVDAPEDETRPPAQVNCAERMHVCQAICCQLDFALTQSEVESGRVKWDLGRPYYIRHEENGFCTHNDRATGGCGVYENRPAICRNYSCANDTRIWKDFEKMELNEEWLAENLAPSRPRALRVLMHNVSAAPAPPAADTE